MFSTPVFVTPLIGLLLRSVMQSTNPILIQRLLPHSPSQLQIPSTIAVWLSSCLPDSGSDPLPIDFILDWRLWISWFPRLRFCERCRNLEFTLTITNITFGLEEILIILNENTVADQWSSGWPELLNIRALKYYDCSSVFHPCIIISTVHSNSVPSFVPITLGFHVLENRTTRCVTCMRICSDRTLKSSVQLPLASIRPIQILGYIIQCITSSVTVRSLTVPVPSLDKGGGRR